jgi:hypothetical protein
VWGGLIAEVLTVNSERRLREINNAIVEKMREIDEYRAGFPTAETVARLEHEVAGLQRRWVGGATLCQRHRRKMHLVTAAMLPYS